MNPATIIDLSMVLRRLEAAEELPAIHRLSPYEPQPSLGTWVWYVNPSTRLPRWWQSYCVYESERWAEGVRRGYNTHWCVSFAQPTHVPHD